MFSKACATLISSKALRLPQPIRCSRLWAFGQPAFILGECSMSLRLFRTVFSIRFLLWFDIYNDREPRRLMNLFQPFPVKHARISRETDGGTENRLWVRLAFAFHDSCLCGFSALTIIGLKYATTIALIAFYGAYTYF